MTYRFLDHSADVGIEVLSENLSDAFIEAVYGLLDLIFHKSMKEIDCDRNFETLEISSNDLESLFVDTLNEILFLIDARKIIPVKLEIVLLSNNSLRLKYKPYLFDFSKLPMHLYVKAVTFHQLEIKETNGKINIKFYLDI